MELTEPIESLNRQLVDLYGIDSISGQPIWRIVWSEDQIEKRLMDVTPEGWPLLAPEVREVPKYRQWIQEKFVLERLVAVPDFQVEELAGTKISYEPLFVFEDKHGNALPPRIDVCQLVINNVYAVQGKIGNARYIDDYSKYTEEAREKRISELMEYLWDPSKKSDDLHVGQGIVVPHNYTTQKREN